MHYYQFNIADYRKDTAHLKPIEHYIYRTLIDWYYLNESPIPLETHSVMRRLCLGSEDEANLLNVLSDFFKKTEEGWVHKRINQELTQYATKCETNRINGKQGGRPKKTQSVIFANPNESESNPNQEPITKEPVTINQEPREGKHAHAHVRDAAVLHNAQTHQSPPFNPSFSPTPGGIVCQQLKMLGIAAVNPSHPDLLNLLKEGTSVEEIVNCAYEAKEKGKTSFLYILSMVRGRRKEAADMIGTGLQGRMLNKRELLERSNHEAVADWVPEEFADLPQEELDKLGLTPRQLAGIGRMQ